jgi:ParB family chromosome partitioning protein
MAETMEFPSKTRQFLNYVGITRSDPATDSQQAALFLPLDQISLRASQPRRYFSPQAMDSLVESIRVHGILQPLLVRSLENGLYELVAGERRYRAAQTLGVKEVPVALRHLSEEEAMAVSLLENLQREDLNPIEETEAILQLLSIHLDCSATEAIALLNQVAHLQKQGMEITNNVVRNQWEMVERLFTVVGRLTPDSFRSHRLPLLNLPDELLDVLRSGEIEYTKARILAQLKDEAQRQELLKVVLADNLSVREIKKRIASLQPPKSASLPTALPHRFREVYRRVKEVKVWEDPKKAKTLEKLLGQIESLID